MIVLDTNVLSELARPQPEPAVVDWVDGYESVEFVITALTAAEIRAGVALLPPGRRQREVGQRMETLLTETFSGRILAFDVDSTAHYASILATRRRIGRLIGSMDAQIAAVCAQHESALATRNTDDFTELGLTLIDPWQSS